MGEGFEGVVKDVGTMDWWLEVVETVGSETYRKGEETGGRGLEHCYGRSGISFRDMLVGSVCGVAWWRLFGASPVPSRGPVTSTKLQDSTL